MQKGSNSVIYIIVFLLVFSSCKFRSIEKNGDWRIKYEAALQYYEKEDYYRASVLFEQIVPIVRGLPEGEQVQFWLAYSQFNQRIYQVAAHYFKNFYETYGRSQYVEEARYMYAYSLYTGSPNTNLDQTSTVEAIDAMQNFINKYPGSKYSEEAGGLIDEMQLKLERKGYDNAFQYFKLKMYSAAVVALDNFQIDFPDSDLNEDALYYKMESQYNYALQSINIKQSERFEEAKKSYEKFIDRYPESKYLRDGEKIYSDIIKRLKEINKN